jgi:hypothetical protein
MSLQLVTHLVISRKLSVKVGHNRHPRII